jgi:Uma2 family endonuclease
MATVTTLLTAEELLALPDDGTERWLINGELREQPMAYRNRMHGQTMTYTATELANWLRQQPQPRGQILTGDAGVRLSLNPDTIFGVDVLYASAALLAQQQANSTIITGVPTLAVEILSPNDRNEDTNDKIDAFARAGVPLVWVIDPRRRTVTVHRPDAEPELVNVREELTAEPHLPGFRVPVLRLFE